MIFKTEKKHWVNGHQVRGGWFHTLNISLFGYGLQFAWGDKHENGYGTITQKLSAELFKLI